MAEAPVQPFLVAFDLETSNRQVLRSYKNNCNEAMEFFLEFGEVSIWRQPQQSKFPMHQLIPFD